MSENTSANQYNHNLEQIKQAFVQYNFEINNLWQRSLFLFGFLVLIYTAYGNLQIDCLKENSFKICDNIFIHKLSCGICIVGVIFSILWIMMAKGSKNIQNCYEKMIKEIKLKSPDLPYLVQLGEFKCCNGWLLENRYSPSKINIIIGWINFAIFGFLSAFHLCHTIKSCCAVLIVIMVSILVYCLLACFLNGKDDK